MIAAWYESSDIYALRVLPNGSIAPGWTVNGTLVSDPTRPNEYQHELTPDGSGGAYVVWEWYDSFEHPSSIQHVSATGARFAGWPTGGLRLASTAAQFNPDVANDGQGGALAVWEERNGTNSRFGVFAQRFLADGIVAAQLSLASTEVRSDQVTLIWHGAGAADLGARVERRAENGAWQRLGGVTREAPDRVRYEDRDVTSGARYAYRLFWVEAGAEQTTGENWVDVPGTIKLSLEGLRPNPAVDAINVSFALATAAPASLELLDLAGRMVLGREVGMLGAGRHRLRLDTHGPVAAGMYWLRLRQDDRDIAVRAVVMR